MLTKTFVVHGAQAAPVTIITPYQGATIEAKVPGVEIEMVSEDGSGSHTARFVIKPEEQDSLLANFAAGRRIKVTYDLVENAASEEPATHE